MRTMARIISMALAVQGVAGVASSVFSKQKTLRGSRTVQARTVLDAIFPDHIGSAAEMEANLPKRTKGYYDPHNHYTGVIKWNGIGLATEGGAAAMTAGLNKKDGAGKAALENFIKAKCVQGQGGKREESRAPFKDETHLYVYQFIHSGKVCGVDICAEKAGAPSKALCPILQDVSHSVNLALAKYLTTEIPLADAGQDSNPKVFNTEGQSVYKTGGKNLLGSANLYGSMTLHPLLLCLKNFMAKIKGKYTAEQKKHLANNLMSAMSAAPQIDFDTSYGSRGAIMKSAAAKGDWIDDFTLQTLIDEDVSYVEMSNSVKKVATSMGLIGGAEEGSEYKLFNKATKISTRGFPETTDKPQDYVKTKWSLMHLTSTFSKCPASQGERAQRLVQKVEDPKSCVRVNKKLQCHELKKDNGCGGCDEGGMNVPVNGPPMMPPDVTSNDFAVFKEMLKNPDVAGMDYASPESSCFTDPEVKEGVESHLVMVYNAAKETHKRKNYHVHCGEGFPIYDKEKYFKEYPQGKTFVNKPEWLESYHEGNLYNMKKKAFEHICTEAGKDYNEQQHMQIVYCGHFKGSGDMKPCQVSLARRNMAKMSAQIGNVREERKADFDTLVNVRFGHATWATYKLAMAIREAGIQADCDISSNLATQAYTWPVDKDGKDLPWPSAIFSEHPGAQAVAVHKIKDLERTKAALIRGFANHGFLPLFIAGVKLQLGTDGSGVEHSNHYQDYKIAAILLNHLKNYKIFAHPAKKEAWEAKLLLKWEADKGKKLPKAKWTLKTLLGYAAGVQNQMR